jgi:hypothetical protein
MKKLLIILSLLIASTVMAQNQNTSLSGPSQCCAIFGGQTTTQQNALTGVPGMTIFNSTTSRLAIYDGSAWQSAFKLSGDTSTGAVLTSSATAGIGYATGAGSTVTQATSKSTGVTLNTPTGTITMNGAALNTVTTVGFTLTNSSIAATDLVIVNIKSGATASSYFVQVGAVAAGSCLIEVRNYTGGSLSDTIVLSYAVIKGVAS